MYCARSNRNLPAMTRSRLAGWNFWILALALVGVGFSIYLASWASLSYSVDSTLLRRARLYKSNPGSRSQNALMPNLSPGHGETQSTSALDSVAASREGIDPIQLQNFQESNEVLRPILLSADKSDPTSLKKAWDKKGFRAATTGQETFNQVEEHGDSLRILSLPLRENGKIVGVLQFATPLRSEQDQLSEVG